MSLFRRNRPDAEGEPSPRTEDIGEFHRIYLAAANDNKAHFEKNKRMRERWSHVYGQQLFLGSGTLAIETRPVRAEREFTIERFDIQREAVIDLETRKQLDAVELGRLCNIIEHSEPNDASQPADRHEPAA